MNVTFSEKAWEQYISWLSEPKTLKRINRLIAEAARNPGVGTGKPERLAENLDLNIGLDRANIQAYL